MAKRQHKGDRPVKGSQTAKLDPLEYSQFVRALEGVDLAMARAQQSVLVATSKRDALYAELVKKFPHLPMHAQSIQWNDETCEIAVQGLPLA